MTAEPTNTSILQSGATLVWADVDQLTGNIDPDSVREKISSKTKAIVIVHYAGYPVRLAEILKIGDEHGIPVIEDCAHALGATYNGKSVGTLSDFAIFSFQAIKHMTTVDGGVITLKNSELLTEAKKIRWFGMLKGIPRTEVDITNLGFKYNMSNVTAVIGNCQLAGNVDFILGRHIANGKFFDEEISKISGLSFAKCELNASSSYWLYTMLCDDSESVEKALISAGVSASKLHRPNNLHSIFNSSKCSLPGLDKFYRKMLHIPCGWWVTDEDRVNIIEVLRKG